MEESKKCSKIFLEIVAMPMLAYLPNHTSLESQKQEFIKKNIRIEIGSATDTISERPIDHELKENDLLLGSLLQKHS